MYVRVYVLLPHNVVMIDDERWRSCLHLEHSPSTESYQVDRSRKIYETLRRYLDMQYLIINLCYKTTQLSKRMYVFGVW